MAELEAKAAAQHASGWLVGLVQKYGISVVFISNGTDDECGVRKPLGGASLPMNRDSYSNLYK